MAILYEAFALCQVLGVKFFKNDLGAAWKTVWQFLKWSNSYHKTQKFLFWVK